MHHRCEIVMPKVDDVEGAVKQILEPFDENNDGEYSSNYRFWDFWIIGGRFAGSKLEERMGEDRMQEFRDKLVARKVTVSGLQAGKPTLSPASQIPEVDALWTEMFPDSGITVCPLFDHTNDKYSNNSQLPGDVCTLADLPPSSKCERVIIAGPRFEEPGLEAEHMEQTSFWNGVNHINSTWDGQIMSAVMAFKEKIKGYAPDYAATRIPQDDWIVVTVDYHS